MNEDYRIEFLFDPKTDYAMAEISYGGKYLFTMIDNIDTGEVMIQFYDRITRLFEFLQVILNNVDSVIL